MFAAAIAAHHSPALTRANALAREFQSGLLSHLGSPVSFGSESPPVEEKQLLVTAHNQREQTKARLQNATPAIAPSILLCDYARLGQEIADLEAAGAQLLHLDVMDGHFVPNFTFGMTIVEAARRCTDLPLDVHLMMEQPGRYVRQFREAGADVITVHEEVCRDQSELADLVAEICELDALAGIAINPPTPLDKIDRVASDCDLILCMSVMPGFGGQKFDRVALDKLAALRDRDDVDAFLQVDGGVNADTIADCANAGANLLVVGSAISSGAGSSRDNYKQRFTELEALIK